jgi:hypothetical protein
MKRKDSGVLVFIPMVSASTQEPLRNTLDIYFDFHTAPCTAPLNSLAMFFLQRLTELFNTPKMTPTTKICSQPGTDNILRNATPNHPFTQTKDIGIIMLPTHARRIVIMTEGGAHMRISVGSHGHANTRATNQYSALDRSGINQLTDHSGNLRIIHGNSRITTHVLNLMTKIGHQYPDHLLQTIPTMIGANCYLHINLLSKGISLFFSRKDIVVQAEEDKRNFFTVIAS